MNTPSSKFIIRFLRWFCRRDSIEEVEGNLMEMYEKSAGQSRTLAEWRLVGDVLRHFRPAFIKRPRFGTQNNTTSMFAHHLLIAFRNFRKYRTSFTINIVGLTAGLTSALLIYLWVNDELLIDRFHDADQRLFQIRRHTPGADGQLETHSSNSILLPAALVSTLPEVEYVVPMRHTNTSTITFQTKTVKATGAYAGKDFFKIFSFPIIHGSTTSALDEKYNVAISEQLAIDLFGTTENAIGKQVTWNLEHFGADHVVSAVFQKSELSSEPFDFLSTHELFLEKNRMDVNWDSNPITVNIALRENTDVASFELKLNDFYRSVRSPDPEWRKEQMFIQPYSDLYLYNQFQNGVQSGGRIDYVKLFLAIGVFSLVIACINFMNLSTARALRRVKEIGVRKTIGARRQTLIAQHLGEAMLMSFVALVVSIVFVVILLPQFNLLTGKHLSIFDSWSIIPAVIAIALGTGLLAGSYPAFYLSAFKPVDTLKGKFSSTAGEKNVRRSMVAFQFAITMVLLIAVLVVNSQLNYVHQKNVGYQRNNLVLIEKQGQLNAKLDIFLVEAAKLPSVKSVTSLGGSLTNNNSGSWGHTWEGQQPGAEELEFSGTNVNFDFFETMGMEIVAGRAFSREHNDDDSRIILNETAIQKMGMTDPVGKWMEMWGRKREIIGVVKDFHSQSMYTDIRPMFLIINPKFASTIVVRIQDNNTALAISDLEKIFRTITPGTPFEYTFLEDEYQKLYSSEESVATIAGYFSAVAIVLSCLGLFGLAAFSTERRLKEISIRQVLGCGQWKLVRLLTSEFALIVCAACLVTLPLSWFLSVSWLEKFAYRVSLNPAIFIGAIGFTMCTALLTVGVQTYKASRINPVDHLKSE